MQYETKTSGFSENWLALTSYRVWEPEFNKQVVLLKTISGTSFIYETYIGRFYQTRLFKSSSRCRCGPSAVCGQRSGKDLICLIVHKVLYLKYPTRLSSVLTSHTNKCCTWSTYRHFHSSCPPHLNSVGLSDLFGCGRPEAWEFIAQSCSSCCQLLGVVKVKNLGIICFSILTHRRLISGLAVDQ